MATVNVTDENFEAEVIKAGKPVIVDFWAEWCGPCKQIGPILEEISNEMSDVVIANIISVSYTHLTLPTMIRV